jgi:hypothetical protein
MTVHTIKIEGGRAFICKELRRLHQEYNGDFWRDRAFWTGVGIGIGIALVAVSLADLIWLRGIV